ncbi:protease SohB [Halioglobus japonicus]|uniref:Protease SohB n=1 Tax=Halioglobus japonicus TaxID=930805 RepID=A0AAP8MIE7_9GAMM|nr:protease SohB [Halioglobus japonicus]AQA18931.1 protease SohB [Halioglobus japonicus]PLW88054.1 protease SohB [Halioglobus japonicus]GHD20612.1 protease [Halioglobus japonicus]
MEFLFEFGLFLAQAVTLVAAILILVAGMVSIGQRQRSELQEGHIEIRNLNEKYKLIGSAIRETVESEDAFKDQRKEEKKAEKKKAKQEKKNRKKEESPEQDRKRLYVLDFDGDIKASATDNLREEISAILTEIRTGDEVLVKVESPGGLVHGYGLAASQLQRFREADVPLTIAVDKVAASGGYMMACVANHIVAAPFAVIGSIGVLAQLPNFHRLLKKHDIDFELFTAGEYKRTLTMFGENTDKGREKFTQELEDTHGLFKQFVSDNRPQLNIDAVATGEVWYGQQAVDKGLVDAIMTSDSFLQQHLADWDVYEVRFVHKKNWQEKLGLAAEVAMERSFLKVLQRSQRPPV